jgi:hypothetical protein
MISPVFLKVATKDAIKKRKKQVTDWEEISGNNMSEKTDIQTI